MVQIEARALALGYGQRVVLPDVNLHIRKGEFISIFGGELHVLDEPVHQIANSSLKRFVPESESSFKGSTASSA